MVDIKVGDMVEALTRGGYAEGTFIPGETYEVVSQLTSESFRCMGGTGIPLAMMYPGEIRPVAKPVVAPVALMGPEELVMHQQSVVREALGMWCASSIGGKKSTPTVVGGAPRDWDYMIPAQDIDIWVKNSIWGEDDLQTLKTLFECKGATVGKVTANTYARDGEYIHYIFNVMWQDVDLQFIFVEDPSVQAVVDHVCCNFSEIAWDWKLNLLQPSHVYKAGRSTRTLVFRDDKGRSPRQCYIEKMSKRYPDHAVVLPDGSTSGTPKVSLEPNQFLVVALETSAANHITKGNVYTARAADNPKYYTIKDDSKRWIGVFTYRFRKVEQQSKHDDAFTHAYVGEWKAEPKKPEVRLRWNDKAPEGYSKFIVYNKDTEKFWLIPGHGTTFKRSEAHVYDKGDDVGCGRIFIWIE